MQERIYQIAEKVRNMPDMTEDEATRLDELYTVTTPKVDIKKPGVFAVRKNMAIILDDFSVRYLLSRMLITKKSPSELISDLIRKELVTE